MASLYRPDGSYLREVPDWLSIPERVVGAEVSVMLPAMLRTKPFAGNSLAAGINWIRLRIGQHANGARKYRLADEASFMAYLALERGEMWW